MAHYDSFPFDSTAWPFNPHASPPPPHPHRTSGELTPTRTPQQSPQFHPYTHEQLADTHIAPTAQPPASSSSFLSPLPIPSLSLAAAPPDNPPQPSHAVKGEADADTDSHTGDALRALIKHEDADGSAARPDARASASAAGPAPTSTPMPGLPSLPSFMPPSFANIPPDMYAQLINQARSTLFGSAATASGPPPTSPSAASPVGQSPSGSLAPQSTYIATPASSSAAAAAATAALSGSLAAAAAQYGLSTDGGSVEGPFSSLPLAGGGAFNALSGLSMHAQQAAYASYQQRLHEQRQSETNDEQDADDAASATTASDDDADGSEDGDAVGAGPGQQLCDEDEPSIYGVAGHLLRGAGGGGGAAGAGAEDYLTPATSAHQSDVEGANKPSPASAAHTPAAAAAPSSSTSTPAASAFGFAPPPPPPHAAAHEGYNPGDPYIPSLGAYYAHLGYGHLGQHAAVGHHHHHQQQHQPKITYREDDPPELPYQSDDSADGDFGAKKGGGGARGRQRTRKASAVPGFAAPKPAPSSSSATSSATPTPASSLDRTMRGGSSTPSSSTSRGRTGAGAGAKKRASPDAVMPGAIDPATGLARRQTEIPAVEDDPSVRPYGCNWCAIDRAERRRVEREVLAEQARLDAKGKGRADSEADHGDDGADADADADSDVDAEGEEDMDAPPRIELSWRTIKELREHNVRHHKSRADNLKNGDEESLMMEMPFRCALAPCDKTFKSLAGLRFHFQNASANGHFFVAVERDDQTGQERATKKFKQEIKPSGRELQCPIARCPKKFKQSAGLAYHLTHTANHPITAALLSTFESTLLSKTKWWLARLNKPLDPA